MKKTLIIISVMLISVVTILVIDMLGIGVIYLLIKLLFTEALALKIAKIITCVIIGAQISFIILRSTVGNMNSKEE